MRTRASKALLLASLFLFVNCANASAEVNERGQKVKEWTFILFLNGHNNLDRFLTINLNQLEKVGSSDDVNFVVQWASTKADKTKRLLVQKDNDMTKVTSPIVEELPRVDMGDYKELVKFIAWSKEHYPAKHYFVDVSDHGSGWHRTKSDEPFKNISNDDYTDNQITTEQLGIAMKDAAKALGQKVDVLGFDACLMAMAEVNQEFASSVGIALASEELIPGLGWPYDAFAARWVAKPTMSARDVVKMIGEEYAKTYLPGGQSAGKADVTLASVDLGRTSSLTNAMKALGKEIVALDADGLAKVKTAAKDVQRFDTYDYADLGDFLQLLDKANIDGLSRSKLSTARSAFKSYMIANHVTDGFKKAQGLAFWLPTSSWTYDRYSERYKKMAFDKATGWSAAIEKINE